ncbi:MAG: hypothetical protein SGJ23_05480 [Alphaproteobacteria bacterium]|nr:hypothetical protein [Alphaproteobacteria bacterium]
MDHRSLATLVAALAVAPNAFAQAPSRTEDEIVVTVERPRGSVPGDVTPEATFSAQDVRSYGASNIFQILSAIAPQTGSASIRGGGMPIVLVNGRRISGFQEIRDLPPDVISRVEVFDEQLSLQYGYSPDQRVVNLVLEKTFSAAALEAGGGLADVDARASTRAEGSYTNINDGDRFAGGLSLNDATSITERERDIAAPTVGPDARDVRTLAPDTQSWRGNASFSRALSERITGNASIRVEGSDQRDLLGLNSANAVRVRESESQTVRGTAGFDGAYEGWQWTTTATADSTHAESETKDSLSPSRTESDQKLYDLTGNVNGSFLDVPAGRMRSALRLGVEHRTIDSLSESLASGLQRTELERTTPSGRFTLAAPLTSRRSEFGQALGDISLNATASWADPSDFAALSSIGFGGSWAPIRTVRLSLQAESSEAAPSLEQLGNPLLVTPDVSFFDAATGQNVRITRTTGGNPLLDSESREDLTFNANWSPQKVQGLQLTFSWARNNSQDIATALPTSLAEAEAAFPTRFTRDGLGVLTAVDARPISIAERDIESLRIGFNFSRPIGGTRPPPGQGGGPRQRPPGAEGGEGPPAAVAQRMGLGGGQQAGGRWNISIAYKTRLTDDVTLAAGQAPIDLLDRGGLNGGSETASGIEFEGGLFNKGIGLRFSGGWTDGYELPVASGGVLDFSDQMTLNARLFMNLDNREGLIRAAPILKGSRLAFAIDNLTDSAVEVRDANGLTPTAYQEGYLNPLGRVVQVSFRKQF